MAFGLELASLAGFAALMVAAAVVDFRRLVIPNNVVLALCVLWPLHFASTRDATLAVALKNIGCAAAVFAGGTILFARGLIGGGDVKLFAAASLWAGAAALPTLLVLTALIGGVLAVAFLTPLGDLLGGRRRPGETVVGGSALALGRTPIPYGVAIAGAALTATIAPHLA